RLLVVDDETEVAPLVRPLRAALRESDELVAQVDERHPAAAAAQLEVAEDPLPECERLVEVGDLERDVVDADRSGHVFTVLRRGYAAHLWRACRCVETAISCCCSPGSCCRASDRRRPRSPIRC